LAEPTAPHRIALVPAGASNMLRQQILRRWPLENYVEIASRLAGRGWEVVLLGGPDDAWVRPHFAGLQVTDCIGTLSLPQVIRVCDSSDAVISHDTGPMHLAGLSTAALVGIYGPTDPAMFLPRRPYAAAIRGGEGFACRPCYDGTDFAPCTFNGCMHQVTPGRVMQELDRILAERQAAQASPWRIVAP
jgi:heptosyltransferase-2